MWNTLPGLHQASLISPALQCGGQQRRLVVAVQAKQSVSNAKQQRRFSSPEPIEMPARNTTAIGSTIKYRIKPKGPLQQIDDPVADFMTKLKLAWDIFFPVAPAEVKPKEEAKQRLRMILVADRCGMSPAGLTEMKRNILNAIEEFVDIDSEEQIDVSITADPDVGTVYSVAVPIRRVKPEARLALNADGDIEDLTFEWNPEDQDADPSARFPYGT